MFDLTPSGDIRRWGFGRDCALINDTQEAPLLFLPCEDTAGGLPSEDQETGPHQTLSLNLLAP